MRNINIFIFCLIVLYSCKREINVDLTGYLITENNEKITFIEVGLWAQNSPIHPFPIAFDTINIDEKGRFEFKIRKNKINSDKKFRLYFYKNNFERKILTVNLLDNKAINLDTIFLKPLN